MADHFGEHLMIDGYEGNEDLLNDREIVLRCLVELPKMMGMKSLSAPEVYRAESNGGKDPGGWTGFVVIQESHISIHTFPKRGFLSTDVYTCKNGLDTKSIIEYFKNTFVLGNIETNFLKRGLKYSSSKK